MPHPTPRTASLVQTRNELDRAGRAAPALPDEDAVALYRSAAKRTLSFVEDLLDDRDLWDRMAAYPIELTDADYAQIRRFADGGLALLLDRVGYVPPPDVEQLIDDTVAAALIAGEVELHHRRVLNVQADLAEFAKKLRRLLITSQRTPAALARRALRVFHAQSSKLMIALTPIVVDETAKEILAAEQVPASVTLSGAAGVVLVQWVSDWWSQRRADTQTGVDQALAEAERALERLPSRVRAPADSDELDRFLLDTWQAQELWLRYGAKHDAQRTHRVVQWLADLRAAVYDGDVETLNKMVWDQQSEAMIGRIQARQRARAHGEGGRSSSASGSDQMIAREDEREQKRGGLLDEY